MDAQRSDKGLTVKTENVRILHLGTPPGALREATPISIDGQNLKATPYQTATGDLQFFLERRDGQWSSAQPERLFTERLRTPEKTTNLQGPIDDAFMSSFLCVRGSGTPWNEAAGNTWAPKLDVFRPNGRSIFAAPFK